MASDTRTPVVTVGMPTFNRARFVGQAIGDILAQTFADFELIVSDDASRDDTESVVRGIADPRIRYFRNPRNLNIPGNINQILGHARGRYIVFLHDHDRFEPDLLERMVAVLEKESSLGFVHTGIAFIDEDGGNPVDVSPEFEPVTPSRGFVDRLLLGETFECPVSACGMVRREAYEEAGMRFDDACGFLSDIDMTLRLGARRSVGFIRQPLIKCRRREEGHMLARPNWRQVQWLLHIHRLNIARCYADAPERVRHAERQLGLREIRLIRQTMLATLVHGDAAVLREGLEFLCQRGSGWARLAATMERGIPGLAVAALWVSRLANRARHAFRSLVAGSR